MPTIKKNVPAKKVAAPTKKPLAPATEKALKGPKNPPKKDAGKKVSKVVSLLISVGDDDRARDMDDFVAALKEAITKCGGGMPNGEVKNITKTQDYYIVDGKVCLRQDFDTITRDFKEGAFPPAWAGGPNEGTIQERIKKQAAASSVARDPIHLETAGEYKSHAKTRTPREALDDLKSQGIIGRRETAPKVQTTDDIEEFSDEDFEWDAADVGSAKVDAAADSVVEDAVKALKSKPVKKVVRRGRK